MSYGSMSPTVAPPPSIYLLALTLSYNIRTHFTVFFFGSSPSRKPKLSGRTCTCE